MIGDLNLLVVEDHDFQREMLVAMLLRLKPRHVYSAGDGQSALDVLLNTPVDVIVSDVDMPNMDGLEFMRRLADAGYRSSVIIVSAIEATLLAATEAMTRAYGINLLGVISKPVTRAALEDLLVRYAPPAPRSSAPARSGPSFTLDEILRGLEEDQFEPFYQPKVDLATRRVVGAEALARWRHPKHGFVAPAAFVKALEDSGRIDELMWAMLNKSAAFSRTLKAAHMEPSIAVNLSLKSLNNVELVGQLVDIVRAHGLENEMLCLEITESAATTNLGPALENLTRLRLKGFRLSIDDFGTGYSSIQQLTRIPFTELKIDRSFVTQSGCNEAARVILKSSLQMARELNLKAVAEGVETQQDWDLLQELGCDLAQGYFIARPMESSVYLQWMRALAVNTSSMFMA